MNQTDITFETEVQLPKLNSWGDDAWRQQANCQGADTNMFFPSKESLEGLSERQKSMRYRNRDASDPSLPRNLLSQARVLCAKCKVRKECLKFAVENGIVHGMYGGIPPRDRRGMTPDNLGKGIPAMSLMRDLHRVRRVTASEKKVPLAYDVADIFNVSVTRAEHMLKHNDFPEYI